ncbi:MAG TPA: choice-of-anchor V domain-containing protein [Gemmatimonadales bacterium]|nr:choice-of-anchor V domain-containing protein [Gemmatimonadales bacterium]
MTWRWPAAHGLAAVLLLGAPAGGPAPARFPDRPPLGHTGGFGEPTCTRCHAGDPVNSGGGTLTLEGLPESYQPGGRYRMAVTVTGPRIRRGGFQLAVRYAGDAPPGRPAGMLRRIDDRVHLAESLGVTYAFHTGVGSVLSAPDRATWAVDWLAPADSPRTVVAHFTANAANDDASELGDFIYADSVVSAPLR